MARAQIGGGPRSLWRCAARRGDLRRRARRSPRPAARTMTRAPTMARALRDGAAMLALAAESQPAPQAVPAMVGYVTDERAAGRPRRSTQENAWMLLAARAMRPGRCGIELDGQRHGACQAISPPASAGEELSGRRSRSSTGASRRRRGGHGCRRCRRSRCRPAATASPSSAPITPLDGARPMSAEAAQNERYVVVIKVDADNDWPARIVVTDLCRPASRSTIPSLVSSAELEQFRAGCRRPRRRISSSATTASSPPSTATRATTARSPWPMWCAR